MDSETIKLGQYGTSLGPRGLGKQLRETTLRAIQEKKKVFFDFSGVRTISSAFADELFGLLFVELGENEFTSSLKINNFDNDESKKLILVVIQKGIDFRRNSTPRT